jgi:hypothetical protein
VRGSERKRKSKRKEKKERKRRKRERELEKEKEIPVTSFSFSWQLRANNHVTHEVNHFNYWYHSQLNIIHVVEEYFTLRDCVEMARCACVL